MIKKYVCCILLINFYLFSMKRNGGRLRSGSIDSPSSHRKALEEHSKKAFQQRIPNATNEPEDSPLKGLPMDLGTYYKIRLRQLNQKK